MAKGLVFELSPYMLTPKIKNKVINSNVQIYDSSHGNGTMSAIHQAIEEFECNPLECKCLITIQMKQIQFTN
jgi:hypothetical protein